jgi:UDP-GlcNAc3NAcA epimerase
VKAISIIGARPQFIKVMPVNRALGEAGHQSILVHTGQHYDYQMSEILAKNIQVIEPVGYFDMLWLESNADCILPGSGGIQKEAYWLGVRCITLREETEWVETVQAGWNRLVGVNPCAIIDAVNHWLPEKERIPIFGGGNVA